MKLLKRNQIVILVITLMFITIGYLSYNPSTENKEVSSSLNNGTFGDAALVSSDDVLVSNDDLNSEQDNTGDAEVVEESIDSSISTNSKTNKFEDYFVSSKLQREAMYSQMIEAYQRILDNKDISQEQKTLSGEEINKINSTRNAIMICENLIKNKDIEDVVIFVNDDSVNIVIKSDNPGSDLIAQVQNIVSRELGVEIENIHISSK